MMLKRWMVCLLALAVCLGLATAAESKDEKKKEEKKEEKKKDEKKPLVLPDAVSKTIKDSCKDAEVVEAKEKKEADKVCGYEVKLKDKCEKTFKVVLSADGKVMEESKHKVPSAGLPAAVADAAKKWAPAAKLAEMAQVETKKDTGTCYEVEAEMCGKTIKAKIGGDGKLIKGDELPQPKAEKKEEKKEKKEEKKEKKEKKD
ncbi:MAG: PepSY-like domain-containing protein [Planctomycetota bacterium]|nr:PepSY-like domain-containing protein [Planctomycetota bacterium]